MPEGMNPEELIARYCDLNAVFQAVYHKKYAAASAEIKRAMQQITAEQTEQEDRELLANCFLVVLQYDVFYRLLDAIGCELTESYDDRAAMRADYECWKRGDTPGDTAWLTKPHSAVKIRLFKAIDALSLSVSDFDEIPQEDILIPKLQKKTYGNFEMVTIADAIITDDGGLAADPDPSGKDYTLTDADGVRYHLHNVRKTRVPGGLRLAGGTHFTADGWIEGYTGRQTREIEFDLLRENGTVSYVFSYGTDDAEAEPDPRFAAYEAWVAQRIENRRRHRDAFLAEFTGAQPEKS
ncbi:MAG: hypothetical protein IKI58_02665 [Oscillospiraceae bacterium]|nr:hypothetical protein [Oscillospiraceae bacterium]